MKFNKVTRNHPYYFENLSLLGTIEMTVFFLINQILIICTTSVSSGLVITLLIQTRAIGRERSRNFLVNWSFDR